MKNSPCTFEAELRERLLTIIYGQWSHLGAAFSGDPAAQEVIDPEALLWGSLEFLPTEPRLTEAVLLWLNAHKGDSIRQRLKSRLTESEPRTCIWTVIEKSQRLSKGTESECVLPSEPCHGLNSPEQVLDFCKNIRYPGRRYPVSERRVGNPIWGPATCLLRARDLLGSDPRHFILLYLLCNPHGGPLRPLREWTGYSQRTISDTIARWIDARVVSVEHGICRLVEPKAWQAILQQRPRELVLINWFVVFEACIRLLRALAKAQRVGLPPDSSVIATFRQEAYEALASSSLSESRDKALSPSVLLSIFSKPQTGQGSVPASAL